MTHIPYTKNDAFLTQTDWYVSSAGSDSNSGASISFPVKTIMGGIVSKWGTNSPILNQTTTIHILDSQSLGDERIVLSPILSGTATNFVMVGTPANVGSTFSAGTIISKSVGNPGTDLIIGSMPGGAAAGILIHNITRGSYALIGSMSGSAATVCQPFTAASITTPSSLQQLVMDNSWTTGDTLQLQSLPLLNLESIQCTGGDSNSSSTTGAGWIQMLHIPDISGTVGASTFTTGGQSVNVAFSLCITDPFFEVEFGGGAYGCLMNGGALFGPDTEVCGGALHGTINVSTTQGVFFINSDVIVTGQLFVQSGIWSVGGVHITSGSSLNVFTGANIDLVAAGAIWGTGTINNSGLIQKNNVGNTWAQELPVANLNLDLGQNGYGTAGGINYGPFAITPANLDTYNGLVNPSTGSRYSSGAAITPPTPVVLTQTDWYLNGTSGNDSNDGKTSGTPIRTLTGGLFPRWGTNAPKLNQSVTIHVIGTQTSGQERIVLQPTLMGANTNLIIDGTAGIVYGSTFTAGTVTNFVWGSAGNAMTIASMPGTPVVGQIITNITRGTNGIIRAVSGTTVTVCVPIITSSEVVDMSWTTGDSIKVGTLPYLNIEAVQCLGGDTNTSDTGGLLTVTHVRVPDISGVSGDAICSIVSDGAFVEITECVFDSSVISNRPINLLWLGCAFFGGCEMVSALIVGGTSTFTVLRNCSVACVFTTTGLTEFYDTSFVFAMACEGTGNGQIVVNDNATIMLGNSVASQGYGSLWSSGGCHLEVSYGAIIRQRLVSNPSPLWSSVLQFPTGQIYFINGTHGDHGAIAYIPNTNTWHSGLYLNAANLDAWGVLYDGNTSDATLGVVAGPYSGAGFIGQSVPTVPPTWTQQDWYWDPAGTHGGSDTNSGAIGSPLLTWAGFIAKMGTSSPKLPYGQSIIIHKLSAQTAGQDYVVFEPFLSGPANAVLLDTPTTIGGPVAAGTVTAQSRGGPGTRLQIATAPAGTAQGDIIFNTTRSSYAVVDVMSGSTAVMGQPQASAPLTTVGPPIIGGASEVNTWVTGDTITVFRTSALNLRSWKPRGGEQTSSSVASVGWIQWSHLLSPDTTLDSAFIMENETYATVFSLCRIDPDLTMSTGNGNGGSGSGSSILGSYINFAIMLNPGCSVYGCVFEFGVFQGGGVIENDSIVHDTWAMSGPCGVNSGFSDGTISITHGSLGVGGILWGSGSLNLGSNATYVNNSVTGTFAQSIFLSGGLFFNQHAPTGVGSRFIPTTDTWHSQIPLTIANLDLWAGLECEEADARFISATSHPIPTVPPSWTQTNWYWDPANTSTTASDSNSGADSSHALLTWAGFISKMGTEQPRLPYGQSIIIHKLSAQSASVDPVVWAPYLSGGGQTAIIDTLVVKTASFTGGTVTAQVRGTSGAGPGTRWQVTGFPSGTAAGDYVYNVTRNSYANVDVGGVSPIFDQPVPSAVLTTLGYPNLSEDNTWTTGDSFIVYTRNLINLKSFAPEGGDQISSTPCLGWLQWCKVADPSGSGFSSFLGNANTQVSIISGCSFQSGFVQETTGLYIVGCYITGTLSTGPGDSIVFGGIVMGGVFATGNDVQFDGDAVIHGFVSVYTNYLSIGDGTNPYGVFSDGTWTIEGTAGLLQIQGPFWGSYTLRTFSGSVWINAGGATTYTLIRTTTALLLNSKTVGSAYVAATDTWHSEIPITVANLDAWGALQDPVNGGGFFTGGTQPTVPPSWTQGTWYWDPANTSTHASDNNSGADSSHPLLTWAGFIAKIGKDDPILPYGQSIIVNQMSSQSAGVDSVFFEPKLSGGGQFVLNAMSGWVAAGANFSAGTLGGGFGHSGAVPTAGGTPMTMASVPGYVVKGTLLNNTTRNSYAFVDSVSGGIATITQPHAASGMTTTTVIPLPTADNDWVAGDSITPYTLPNLNLKWNGTKGGDLVGTQPCAHWVLGASIPDTSGSQASDYPFVNDAANAVLSLCIINSRLHISQRSGRGESSYLLGCLVLGLTSYFGGGQVQTFGGSLAGGLTVDTGEFFPTNNTLMHGAVNINSGWVETFTSAVYADGAWTVSAGALLKIAATFWGSYSLSVQPGGTVFNTSGASFVSTALLTTGPIALNGVLTGTAYAQNGIFYGPFALTPANLDTYGGLQDPVTGARIVGVVGSLPLIPVSWTQTDWYLDGSAGNDNNPGTIGSPIKTIMGGIVPKWGTASPRLSQTTTIHVVNSQSIGLERAVITPIISGTATNFVIVGTPTFGSTFSAGTTTALSAGNPGNDWTIASMPGGTAAGQLVFNVTRSSYAIIDSMSGSTATICQPFSSSIVNTVTAFPNPISITTWTTGDTIQVGTLPILNLEGIEILGGDTNSGFTAGTSWIQFVHVPDISGVDGSSGFTIIPTGCSSVLMECVFDSFLYTDASKTSFDSVVVGCVFNGGARYGEGSQICGGSVYSILLSFGANFRNNHIVHGAGVGLFGPVTSFNGMHLTAGAVMDINPGSAANLFSTNALWGAGTINNSANVVLGSGLTWTNALKIATLQFNENIPSTTGMAFASNGQFYGPFSLTSANLDLYGGLSNPALGTQYSGGTVPATPVSWTQTNWYLDGSAGVDTNSGADSGHPVKTVMGGIVPRWGTNAPQLAQTTTINVLVGQATNLERIAISPILQGQNTNLVIVGTAANVGSTFSAGTVTPKAQGNPGTDLIIASMPGGTVAGQLVFNSTRNSYALIHSMSSTTATMCQPFTTASTSIVGIPTMDNTWTTGDTLQIESLPTLNIESIIPSGGDQNTANSGGTVWVKNIHVPDTSGTNGTSELRNEPHGAGFMWTFCVFDPYVTASSSDTENDTYIGCRFNGGATPAGTWGGSILGFCFVIAGSGMLDDVIINATVFVESTFSLFASGIHLIGTLTVEPNCGIVLETTNAIWGAGTIINQGSITLASGSTWANTLKVATLHIDNSTTGFANAGDITYGPFLVTSANLDNYGGLCSPNTGSRYSNGTNAVPISPVTWSQATWNIDPQNVETTSSDNNSGASTSVALRTWAGLVSKWGTNSPTLRQATTVTFLSSHTDNTDPVVAAPVHANGGYLTIQGASPTVVATVSLSSVTSKNRTAGSNSLLKANLGASGAQWQMLQNTTGGKSSRAWAYSALGGNVFSLTQPLAPIGSLPITTIAPPEVDTWANTDSVQLLSLIQVHIVKVSATIADFSAGFNNALYVYQLALYQDGGLSMLDWGNNTLVIECSAQNVIVNNVCNGLLGGQAINCYLGSTNAISSANQQASYIGGAAAVFNVTGIAAFDGDFIFANTGSFAEFVNGALLGFVYLDTGITVDDGLCRLVNLGYGNGIIYGSGSNTINLRGSAQFVINTGSTFVAAFTAPGLLTGAQLNGATIGYATAANGITYGPFVSTPQNLDTYVGLRNLLTSAAYSILNLSLPSVPVTWTQASWHLNGSTGNDTTGDGSSGNPFQTYSKGLVSRWGTTRPQLAQATTLNVDGYQAVGLESVDVDVQLVGTLGSFTIQGTTSNLGSPFVPTGMTIETQGVSGTDWQVVVPSGAPTTNASAGVLVFNSTRTSWAYITNVTGSTLTITRPQKFSVSFPQAIIYDNSWMGTDTLQYQTVPTFNMVNSTPRGGSDTSTDSTIHHVVRFLHIPDASGTPGESTYNIVPHGPEASAQLCWIDAFLAISSSASPGWSVSMWGCYCPAGMSLFGSGQSGGLTTAGLVDNNCLAFDSFIGKSLFNLTVQDATISGCSVQGPAQFRGNCSIDGHFTGTVTIEPGNSNLNYNLSRNDNGIWGGATVNVHYGKLSNDSGQTWANMLRVATLQIDGQTTGNAIALNNVIYGPILITSSNLDTYGGLNSFGTGSGYVGGTIPALPITWSQSTWYWDPANTSTHASDNNDGKTNTTPLFTWSGFISKMGTDRPILPYGQSIQVNQISAQPAGQDEVHFEPRLSNGGQATLMVTLASAGANFSAGTLGGGFGYSGAAPSAGGTQMTMASVPGYVVAKTLLQNITRGSYAFVDTVVSSVASLSQPQTAATVAQPPTALTFPAVDNDWVAGDTIAAWTCQLVNLSRWSPVGSDRNSSQQPCGGFVFFARISDTSTTNHSSYNHYNQSDWNVLSCCQVDASLQMNAVGSRSNGAGVWGCYLTQQTSFISGNAPIAFGGILSGGIFCIANGANFTNNVVLHGASSFLGTDQIILAQGAFSDGQIAWGSTGSGTLGSLWGSYTFTVAPGCVYVNQTGSTFTAKALLTNGAIKFGIGSTTTTTGSVRTSLYVADGISITPANLDLWGSIFDESSGARITSITPTTTTPFRANHAGSPYTLTVQQMDVWADVSAGTITMTIPSGLPDGFPFSCKNIAGDASVNNITITAPGGDTIEQPNGGGSYGASAIISIKSESITWQRDAINSRWSIV